MTSGDAESTPISERHPHGSTADGATLASTAQVEAGASIGAGTRVWELAQIRAGAVVGSDCVVGRGAFIDTDVVIGDRCKVQNNALVYAPARLADGVFIGPATVLTNDRFPRAVTAEGELKSAADWDPIGVHVGTGASVGAGATVIGGVVIGEWALVAAGSVVTRDVEPHALVAGSPARRVGWVGRAGVPLEDHDGVLRCPATGESFHDIDGSLEPT